MQSELRPRRTGRLSPVHMVRFVALDNGMRESACADAVCHVGRACAVSCMAGQDVVVGVDPVLAREPSVAHSADVLALVRKIDGDPCLVHDDHRTGRRSPGW